MRRKMQREENKTKWTMMEENPKIFSEDKEEYLSSSG
jgi:hypothetical protein